MSRLKRLLVEVHRRSLWQLLGSYIVGAWLVLQLAETLASLIGLPLWFGASVIALLGFGFLLVLTTGLVKVIAALGPGSPVQRSGLYRVFNWKNASIAGVVALTALVLGTAGYMGMRVAGIGPAGTLISKGILAERDRIVLADFEDNANDSTLALAATEALRIDLDQSPVVRVVEPDYVERTLRRMERSPSEYLDYETARQLAIREGLKAVIAGGVRSIGDGYMLSVRLVAAEDGDVLTSLRETASDTSQFIRAIDRLSDRLRERVGESLKSIRASEPLEQVTTASLEALRLYSKALRSGDFFERVPLLEQAVEVDTTFAMAYAALGARLAALGIDVAGARAALARAYGARDRLTESERRRVEGIYHMEVTGDVDGAITAHKRLLELDSDNQIAYNNLGYLYMMIRDLGRVEYHSRRGIEADSGCLGCWQHLFTALQNQGKLDEAELVLDSLAGVHPNAGFRHTEAASLAVSRGDYEAAEEHARRRSEAVGDTRGSLLYAQAWSSTVLANLAALQGRLAEARRHHRRAMAAHEESGSAHGYVRSAINLALLDLWHLADTASAARVLGEALERYPIDSIPVLNRPYLELVRYWSYAGQPTRARALLEQYEATVEPPLRPRHGRTHNRILGMVALSEGRVDEAIAQLGPNDKYWCAVCALPPLGWAYELAGQRDSALVIYERYATTPWNWRAVASGDSQGLKDAYWLPVVYERLGHLYEQRGDTTIALRYYGRLIDLWKNADPELQPRVEAARRAIEALRSDT